ncbi:MAG: class I SAM-dependent methyltransferase [Deltaproteobacteria bacterium]|nr:class I SAM-dependent methyltransferase [Candidatus Anaeroferrophillus wilburensis]MBN2889049.1 class I SAM-dependent methyltransferase [Deltaproteobacteria bacterium]
MKTMKGLNFKAPITDRMAVIRPFVAQGSVLDLGVVDSRRLRHDTLDRLAKKPNLLFRQICEINVQAFGVDIDDEGIEILRQQGFHVQTADVVTMSLEQRFDTIIAGEIIEHLDNPGQFLRNMGRHLTPTGTLIISTPNPFYCKQIWKILRRNQPSVHEEHTCWFDPSTLSHLCRMSGLDPYAIYWLQSKKQLFKTWPQFFRTYFSHSFMVLAKQAQP